MKKVLLIGNAPLPQEEAKIRPAAGLRTFQFLSGLRGVSGLDIRLVTISMPGCYIWEPVTGVGALNGVKWLNIGKNEKNLISEIQAFHDEIGPDVVVGVNTYPSYVAAGLKSRAIFWADLNGWIMAEAQAQAYKMGGNDLLAHYFEMEKVILKRADKISCVSEAQSHAVLGELAVLGRLNCESFGYGFVEHVPNGVEVGEAGGPDGTRLVKLNGKSGGSDGRGAGGGLDKLKDLAESNFIALWLGGYNTWVDEDTLFKGLEVAMKYCPKFYFVSTGGAVAGLDGRTFERFKKMVEGSEYKERFVFLGWVNSSEIPLVYECADVGLNVDRECVETLTGARNRINEMMKFGLPVVSTLGSEISREMAEAGAGIGVESGDEHGFSQALMSMYGDWEGGGETGGQGVRTEGNGTSSHGGAKLREYGEKGVKYVREVCDYKVTLKPLLNWLKNPKVAPDRGVRVDFGGAARLKGFWKYLKDNGFKKSFAKFLQKMRK